MANDHIKRVYITIKGNIDSLALYAEVKRYQMNVLDLEDRCYVYGTIDIREPLIEYILKICYKYGQPIVDLESAKNPSK